MIKKRLRPVDKLTLTLLPLLYIAPTISGTGYVYNQTLFYIANLALILTLLHHKFKNRVRLRRRSYIILFGIFYTMLVPLLTGFVLNSTTVGINYLFINCLIYFFFAVLLQIKIVIGWESWLIAVTFMGAGLLSTVLGIVFFLWPTEIAGMLFGRPGYFRMQGAFSTPNRFAESVAVGFLSVLYLLNYDKKKTAKYILSAVFLLLGLIWSGSRGVLLATFLATGFYMLFSRSAKKKPFVASLFALLIVVVLFTVIFWELLQELLQVERLLSGDPAVVTSNRTDIWRIGLDQIMNKNIFLVIFGSGANGFSQFFGNDTHSAQLYLLFDYGILGFTFVTLLLVFVFVAAAKKNKKNRNCLAYAGALVVFSYTRGFTMPTVYTGFNFASYAFWAGILLALCNRYGANSVVHRIF
ncbi:O-antigen ligase family protein [Alkalispirochaeta alkalica]|uniref:O-antigen ligase family protein n=1 Tax=Alkalispirochaeta alkalica TaxID=46356 RepID=UPI0003A9083B|nr:O-antigen ligase family protein [Alkalispirochaeta alkalica]